MRCIARCVTTCRNRKYTLPVSAMEAAWTFYQALNVEFEWCADSNPPEERPALLIDSTLARQTLGWIERFPGNLGIQKAAKWYAENDR